MLLPVRILRIDFHFKEKAIEVALTRALTQNFWNSRRFPSPSFHSAAQGLNGGRRGEDCHNAQTKTQDSHDD